MNKKFIALALAMALPLCQTAYADSLNHAASPAPIQAAEPSGSAQEMRLFTDDCGRQIEIPAEIHAFVPSGPLSQVMLFSLAPEMFVGLAAQWSSCADDYIAESYRTLPYFGQLYGSANLNVEALALAAPQLVIDVGQAKKSIVQDMDELQLKTQIPSVHIEASLETVPHAYRTLGALLGKEEKAEALAQTCQKIYRRTLSVLEKVGENKVNALYVLGEDGLNVLANGAYHAELMDLLTNNVAVLDSPSSKGSGNEVSMEQIALWNPDYIIFQPGSIFATAAERDTWKDLTAIANNQYIEVPEGPHNWMGDPPAAQRYLGLIWLTAELYPQYCDYDVKEEIKAFYELFYGCELTDEQYAALTANACAK